MSNCVTRDFTRYISSFLSSTHVNSRIRLFVRDSFLLGENRETGRGPLFTCSPCSILDLFFASSDDDRKVVDIRLVVLLSAVALWVKGLQRAAVRGRHRRGDIFAGFCRGVFERGRGVVVAP